MGSQNNKYIYLRSGESNIMFLRRFESKVLRHNFSRDCRNIMKFCLFAINGHIYISNQDLWSQNNVFLSIFQSKALGHKFSQDSRNVMKFCLFAISGHRYLIWTWIVKIRYFWVILNRKFHVSNFHMMVETLRNLVYSQYGGIRNLFGRWGESK